MLSRPEFQFAESVSRASNILVIPRSHYRSMTIRVMSWNVNKSLNRNVRIDDQLEFIRNCNVDVLQLQEVRYGTDNKWLHRWEDGLTELGLGEIEHSCDWASELSDTTVPPHSDIGHDNGHITAVNTEWHLTRHEPTIREHVDESERGFFDTHFPEKKLTNSLETANKEIDLWNIRAVPENEWAKGNQDLRNRLRPAFRRGRQNPHPHRRLQQPESRATRWTSNSVRSRQATGLQGPQGERRTEHFEGFRPSGNAEHILGAAWLRRS